MPDLRPTPKRLDVLRAVSAGEVKRYRGWGKGEKTRDEWKPSDGARVNVTRTCNELVSASPRLIAPGRTEGPSLYSPQAWNITEAGRMWLAEHDTTAEE